MPTLKCRHDLGEWRLERLLNKSSDWELGKGNIGIKVTGNLGRKDRLDAEQKGQWMQIVQENKEQDGMEGRLGMSGQGNGY